MIRYFISISLIILFSPIFSLAQSEEQIFNKVDKNNFVYTGIYVAPSFLSSRHYKYYHFGSAGPMDRILVKGIFVGHSLKDLVAFQIGLEFFANSYTSQLDGDHPLPYNSDSYNKVTYDINYYQIPLTTKLFLSERKKLLRFYFLFGLVYRNQMVYENITTYNLENAIENRSSTKFNEHYLFSNLGFGTQISFNNKVSAFVEPIARHNLWYRDKEGKQFKAFGELSYGINLGINYRFN